jgi:capsular exopolysaccharide synthesis family protein
VELRDYLNVIRARKWIIIEAVVIVTLGALLYSLLQAPVYQGEAKVLVSSQDAGAAIFGTALDLSGQADRELQTQVQLMALRPLAEDAIRQLGLAERPEVFLQRVEVSAVGQTNLVTIQATDGNAARAAAIANAMADAYVSWSRDTKRESIKNAADEVQRRLDEAQAQILALGRKIKANKTTAQSADLTSELQIATGLYSTLAQKLEELRVNEQLEIGAGRVVSVAVANPVPVSPQPLRNVALGLAVGLILGLGMAFLLEYLDNTIKSSDEVEKLLGAPVLGHIPSEKLQSGEVRRLTITQHPNSFAAESYRSLRNSLDFVNFEHDIKVLLITSSAPGEGKSTVAANLAASLAQTGKRVVLVNCDFRRPSTEHFFDTNETLGLSDVLAGAFTLNAALQESGVPNLWVLAAGKVPPNPSALLGSTGMEETISALRDSVDWIIIDSPPLLAVADAGVVARWADGVLMVTRVGSSTRDAAHKGREVLDNVGARVIGVVEWGIEPTRGLGKTGYYGYNYGGYYSHYANDPVAGRSGKKKLVDDAEPAGPQGAVPPPPERRRSDAHQKPLGRRVADFVGGLMLGLASFLAVLLLAAAILYGMDRVLGWGILAHLAELLP